MGTIEHLVVAVIRFAPYPADKWSPPRSLFDPKEYRNMVRYTEPPRGGHFAAMEEPEFWAEDLITFFSMIAS